jgi:hypothetical protein
MWKKFSFTDVKQKSALEYLNEFKPGLIAETSGELNIDIEAVEGYVDATPGKLAVLYIFYVVAPKLGYFRKKIFTVAEYSDTGRFPVEIVDHFNDNKKYPEVKENEFNDIVMEILTGALVKNSIENLYQLSKEHNLSNKNN